MHLVYHSYIFRLLSEKIQFNVFFLFFQTMIFSEFLIVVFVKEETTFYWYQSIKKIISFDQILSLRTVPTKKRFNLERQS